MGTAQISHEVIISVMEIIYAHDMVTDTMLNRSEGTKRMGTAQISQEVMHK
jgi:hypothetical protein